MNRVLLIMVALTLLAHAHVNSPDIYVQTVAGPYPISVVVRPPDAIPGVAQVQIRTTSGDVSGFSVSPFPMTGEAAKHPPKAEALTRSAGDAQFFTGNVWIMSGGAWQIKVLAVGKQGSGETSIPVPSAAMKIKPMSSGMGWGLGVFGLLLVVGAIAIIGASVRDAKLEPGEEASPQHVRRGRVAMTFASVLLACVLFGGATWWSAEATTYSAQLYKPLQMSADVSAGKLTLELSDPGWRKDRRLDDFIPDHEHLMHLYALRLPEMDHVYHLHPMRLEDGRFSLTLPSMPAGTYQLYADVVHADGFAETISAQAELPMITRQRITGDDAGGEVSPLSGASDAPVYLLPDGYRMVWLRPVGVRAKQPLDLHFQLVDADGNPATDVVPYMGMAGHAAIVKDDQTVFAHIHPLGTASMAATMLLQPGMEHHHQDEVSPDVSFPYGFPEAGDYRVVVQMRHSRTIETAVFDTVVRP